MNNSSEQAFEESHNDIEEGKIKNKLYNILKDNSDKNANEINCLNKILENSLAVDKIESYLKCNFLDDCQCKLNFVSEEFKVKKEKNKYYFACFEDKKKKRKNHRNNIK